MDASEIATEVNVRFGWDSSYAPSTLGFLTFLSVACRGVAWEDPSFSLGVFS